ncbi:MAG: LPD38 domain-containing protein, partial [Terrimicrobiaceae bacterium]
AFNSATKEEKINQLQAVRKLLEEDGRDTDQINKHIRDLKKGKSLPSDHYIAGGYSDLLDYVNRDKAGAENIIPVYVYSRNPFDYQKTNDIEQVLNVATPEEMQSILQRASYNPDRLKRIIGEGSWNTIESSKFQSAVKRAGFDSFYVSEGGNKNLAVYDSSQIKSAFNVAPTAESKDIRYSFNVAPESHTKLEQVNTYGKTLTDTITSIFKMFKDPEERIKTRIAFIDPNSGLARSLQDQEIYKNGVLRGDLLARAKAQTINLIRNGLQTGIPVVNSDGSVIIEIDEVNNLANSRIMADRLNDNYYVKGSELSGRAFVAEVARALRGKEIMEEDRIHNAKTGEKRNREKQVTQKQIDWAEQQLKNVPEMQEIFDIWKKVNTGLINLWESVGLFSKAEADTYRAKKFYVSLAASNTDLETMMESQLGFTAAGLKSTPKVQKLEGAEYLRDKSGKVVLDENGDPVPLKRNIWENIDKQYASMLAGAYQNQVRKVAVTQLIDAGAARIPTKKRNGVDVGNPDAEGINLRYKDPTNPFADSKGVVHVIVDNATDLSAFESMHYELGPVLKFFGGATNILRAGALLNPMFWIRQLIRDPIHASIVANGGIVTPFHSAKEYINILRKDSEEAKILASRGVIGQYDSTLDLQTFLNQVGTEKVDPSNLQKVFHKLMLMHEASDAATRVAIFKKEKQSALDKGMTEEEAVNYGVMKAREAINFLVHGNSKTLNAARQMIPFLSASITSLDTVYRAATGYNLPASEKAAAKKLFKQRAALMFGASVAYAMLMQDDEEYQKQPNYVKDNNWLIKNPLSDGFIKVPVPYEVGFLFKVVPEVALRYAYGNDTGKEMIKAYKDGLLHNLPTGGVPVPQAIKPALENFVNYSFFTGNPVESIGDARLPVEARGRNASETAKFLSGAGLGFVGLSPAKIDNLVQGYFAEAGTFMFTLADELVYTLQGKDGAARNLEKQPFFKAFMTDPNADKAVANFFDIQQTANRTAQGFNELKNSGRLEEAREMVEDEEKKMLIASAPTLRKFSENMSKVRRQIEIVKNDQSRTPEERRELVNKLTAQYNIIAQQGVKAANTLGIR